MTPLHSHNFLVLYLYGTCFIVHEYNMTCQQLWWSRGSVLAFGTQVCGFTPG